MVYARVNEDNIVQKLSRESLAKYSIAKEDAILWENEGFELFEEVRGEIQEFPLSLRQAIRVARELRKGNEVLLNPIPSYFNGVCWHYSMYVNGELQTTLER